MVRKATQVPALPLALLIVAGAEAVMAGALIVDAVVRALAGEGKRL